MSWLIGLGGEVVKGLIGLWELRGLLSLRELWEPARIYGRFEKVAV